MLRVVFWESDQRIDISYETAIWSTGIPLVIKKSVALEFCFCPLFNKSVLM